MTRILSTLHTLIMFIGATAAALTINTPAIGLTVVAVTVSLMIAIAELQDRRATAADEPPRFEMITDHACTDCVMVIANGDTSGIDDVDAWTARVTETDATESGLWDVMVTGEDTFFSTSPCGFCGMRDDILATEITFIAPTAAFN